MHPDLAPDRLLFAYASGLFPMDDPLDGLAWYRPDPRAVIPLDERFRVSKNLARLVRQERFEIRQDTAFETVMRACAERDETWISEQIVAAYVRLHELGFAHSVECWQGGSLVGGLYGVALGGAFFGESMFSRVRDASKVALVKLVEHLRRQGFILLDTQFMTPHLATFGAYEIAAADYEEHLATAIRLRTAW